MSVLVIQLPARPRHLARGEGASSLRLPAEVDWVLSLDGLSPTRHTRSALALLPRADRVLMMLADADVAWHRLDVPKAPAARLRSALAGALEERLLEDEDTLHFALGSDAGAGRRGWVAVMHRPWLQAWLAAMQTTGVHVDAFVPASAPRAAGEASHGHFLLDPWLDARLEPALDPLPDPLPDTLSGTSADAATIAEGSPADVRGIVVAPGASDAPTLVLAREDGVLVMRLEGALPRALLAATGGPANPALASGSAAATPAPEEAALPVQWSATPAAATAAEAWLGEPVAVLTEPERALRAAQAGPNLLQFDLVPRRRGTRAAGDALRGLLSPSWRPVRWALGLLLGVQIVGLNAEAWRQNQTLADTRTAMVDLLREAHPGVRVVLDAPLQMERETERLRAAAGRAGQADLEALLAVAAAAWPDGQGPVQTLSFAAGRLTLDAPDWMDDEWAQFQQRLTGSGYLAELSGGRITLSRVPARGAG
jgi:general secretion pathway protein L